MLISAQNSEEMNAGKNAFSNTVARNGGQHLMINMGHSSSLSTDSSEFEFDSRVYTENYPDEGPMSPKLIKNSPPWIFDTGYAAYEEDSASIKHNHLPILGSDPLHGSPAPVHNYDDYHPDEGEINQFTDHKETAWALTNDFFCNYASIYGNNQIQVALNGDQTSSKTRGDAGDGPDDQKKIKVNSRSLLHRRDLEQLFPLTDYDDQFRVGSWEDTSYNQAQSSNSPRQFTTSSASASSSSSSTSSSSSSMSPTSSPSPSNSSSISISSTNSPSSTLPEAGSCAEYDHTPNDCKSTKMGYCQGRYGLAPADYGNLYRSNVQNKKTTYWKRAFKLAFLRPLIRSNRIRDSTLSGSSLNNYYGSVPASPTHYNTEHHKESTKSAPTSPTRTTTPPGSPAAPAPGALHHYFKQQKIRAREDQELRQRRTSLPFTSRRFALFAACFLPSGHQLHSSSLAYRIAAPAQQAANW